jgi:hypothetical protein
VENPYKIVKEIEGACNQFIKFEIGKFKCLVCHNQKRYEGSRKQAMEHLKKFHFEIAEELLQECNEGTKKLFIFNKPARNFICLFCNNQFRGSLFNAKDHVASRHKDVAFKLGFMEETEARRKLKLQKHPKNKKH